MSTRPSPPPNTPSTKGEPRASAGRRRPPRLWIAEALGVLAVAAVVDTALRTVVAPFDRVDMIYHFEGSVSSPVLLMPRQFCERTRRATMNRSLQVVVTVPAGINHPGLVPGDRHVVVSVDCNEVTR